MLGLPLLVGLDVVLEVNAGTERSIGMLRSVFEIDFGERQTHTLRIAALGTVAVCDAGDDHVVHLDDEEFVLPLTCFPMRDRRFLDTTQAGKYLVLW